MHCLNNACLWIKFWFDTNSITHLAFFNNLRLTYGIKALGEPNLIRRQFMKGIYTNWTSSMTHNRALFENKTSQPLLILISLSLDSFPNSNRGQLFTPPGASTKVWLDCETTVFSLWANYIRLGYSSVDFTFLRDYCCISALCKAVRSSFYSVFFRVIGELAITEMA